MCRRLVVLALVAVLSPAVLGEVIVDDHFDDDDVETNTTGIGTGFNYWDIGWSGNVTEANSKVILNGPVHGGSRASIASKEGVTLGADICRFESQGVNFAVGNTGTGTTARDCVGVKEDNAAWDYDEGLPTGFWIQFENTSLTANDASAWNGTSVLFYESRTDVKTVLATWEFDTLNWDSGTMDLTPVLNITLDLGPTGYSLTIEGDTISNVTGSLSGTYAAAGITNELTIGYATAYIQSESPGIDISIDQIIIIEGASGPELASLPSPTDGATEVGRNVVLSWTPGVYADTHDVYFGTSFDDVNDAGPSGAEAVQVSLGQDANMFDPGLLDFGQTYYWRIDEVNAAPDNTVFKGNVWSFTAELRYYTVEDVTVTASVPPAAGSGEPEVLVDGSGLTHGLHGTADATMWSGTGTEGNPVWLQFDFDRVYKLYGMHVWNYNGQFEFILGFGFKGVTIEYATEPNEWMTLGDYELTRGTNLPTYAGQQIDLDGLAARSIRINVNSTHAGREQAGLSEIQFLYKPVTPREPQPADGATEVDIDTVLSWRAGREAVSHEVHLGTDSNAVADGTALLDTVSPNAYVLPTLDMATTYYWKIVEVNDAETPTSWAGDVWSFSTPEFILIDGFEEYTDDEGEEIFSTWADGFNDNSNGSQVGNDNPPYAEETIVHSGDQAMPLRYGQGAATTSEATMTLPGPADWTAGGATTLVLYFRGDVQNTPAQVYVKINGTRVDYPGATASLAAPSWKQWNIDLAALGNAGRNVTSMTIGVAGSGSGVIYVDDIRLYREAPPQPEPPVNPGTADLMALYTMEDSLADASGHGYDGTAEVGSSFGPGLPGYGKALVLDGTSGYATLPIGPLVQSLSSATFATWVNWAGSGSQWCRIFDFGTGEEVYMFLTPNSGGSSLRFAITTTSSGGESQLNRAGILSGGWHHVAVAIDGVAMTMQMYLDGELVDSDTTDTLPSDLGATTQDYLGRSQWDDPYLPGSIDDFRIYDRALSGGEIRYLVGDR